MKISIGADHRGFTLKTAVIEHFVQYQWRDVGAHEPERSDYPIYTKKVCHDVLTGAAQVGIIICGSGVGPSIGANRFPGIYAALCWNQEVAQSSKEKVNANVLIIPADYVTQELAFSMIKTWLDTLFLGGRYQDRLLMIDQE